MKISLVCIGFFLGLGLGLLLSHHRSPQGPEPGSIDTAPPMGQAEETEKGTKEVAGDAEQALHKRLAELPAPAKEGGNGVITGSVRTEDRKPLAGVQIRAVRNAEGGSPNRGDQPAAEGLDLETKVRNLVEQHRRFQATSFEGWTDEQGLFRLEGLRVGSYSVQASLEGFKVESSPGEDAQNVQTGSAIHFLAKAEVRLPVTVLLPDGQPPVSAVIDGMRKSPSYKSLRVDWSPAEPEVVLQRGWYELTALHGKNEELRSEPMEVMIKVGVAPSPITLQLEARPSIVGKVVFPEGEEVDSINVFALREIPGKQPGYKDFLGGGKVYNARHRDGFAFSFRDLPPGTYSLATGRVQEDVEVVEEVFLKDRLVEKDLILPTMDPAEYVVLWVYGPGKEVLTEVEIVSECHTESGSASRDAAPIRRPDGSFWVVHQRSDGCPRDNPALRYGITVISQQYGTRDVEYALPREEPLAVEFTEPAFLEVQVTGYEGSGSEGWIDVGISPRSDGKGPRGHRGQIERGMDLRGRKRFGPLDPGPYELTMFLKTNFSPGGSSAVGISKVPITLEPGKNVQSLPMPPLYSLTVVSEGLDSGARMDLRQMAADGSGFAGFQVNGKSVSADGKATFDKVPAGTYKVITWTGGKQGEMIVRVQESVEIRCDPKPLDSTYVHVSDPAGYLSRAGFQTGDLIVGVDGTAFQDQAQMEALLKGSMVKEEIRVRVLRDGKEIDLPFDPRMQRQFKELGGNLWPSSR